MNSVGVGKGISTSIEPSHAVRSINTAKQLHGEPFPTTLQLQRGWCNVTRHEQTALCSLGINFRGPKQRGKARSFPFPLFLSVEKSALIFSKRVKNIRGFALRIHAPFFLKRQVDSRFYAIWEQALNSTWEGKKSKQPPFPSNSTNLSSLFPFGRKSTYSLHVFNLYQYLNENTVTAILILNLYPSSVSSVQHWLLTED